MCYIFLQGVLFSHYSKVKNKCERKPKGKSIMDNPETLDIQSRNNSKCTLSKNVHKCSSDLERSNKVYVYLCTLLR